jgi:hypothetical protein
MAKKYPFRELLERWGLSSLKINVHFLEAEFKPKDADRAAAWELYIELLTRVTTQRLLPDDGDEGAALESLHALFPVTREILRRNGSDCGAFSKIAIPVLNQFIRPVTAKWHRLARDGAFHDAAKCKTFRKELADLQPKLRRFTRALAEMAQVEDLTDLEDAG